jgi:ubiquinone/menaquinone biosynthesis C-methylase UbiE
MKFTSKQYIGKAAEYNKFRQKYSNNFTIILKNKLLLCSNPIGVDVGAGTGIWTRQLFAALPWERLFAIEPCLELLEYGKTLNQNDAVVWTEGTAESLPLKNNTVHLVTFASTFNWIDQEKALLEVWRVLNKGGIISLIWNPIDKSTPTELQKTEKFLNSLMPSKYSNSMKKNRGWPKTSINYLK